MPYNGFCFMVYKVKERSKFNENVYLPHVCIITKYGPTFNHNLIRKGNKQ